MLAFLVSTVFYFAGAAAIKKNKEKKYKYHNYDSELQYYYVTIISNNGLTK
jgi:hypothetical protein